MYWFDGELSVLPTLPLAVDDPALLYGATVFTTLRVYGELAHPLTAWPLHCDRLRLSLKTFGWAEPQWDRLQQGASCLAAAYPVLRITVLPDGRELISGRSLPLDLGQRQQHGIIAAIAPSLQRSLPAHKSGNYLACWLAQQQAKRSGAQEAILVDAAGNWLETSTGNLWGWAEGCWWTPPLTAGILPGVARSRLLTHLQHSGRPAIEASWTPAQVQRFTCLCYSNCVVQLIPIHTVLQERIRLEYNPTHCVMAELRQAFELG